MRDGDERTRPDQRRATKENAGRLSSGLLATVVLVGAVSLARPADASPWILKKGSIVVGLNAGGQFARKEFLPDGKLQRFPLRGAADNYFLEVGGRYGLGGGFEISARTLLKGISYQSDAVLLPGNPPPKTLAENRAAVFDFSQRAVGLADIYVGLGYQHLKKPLRLASSLELKFPTGYRKPRETFNQGTPAPDRIGDDVTLGDGQVDLQYKLELGVFIRATRSVLQLDAGYRARFNGPGHQAIGQIKIGQMIGRFLLLYAAVNGARTVFDGEVIGKSYIAVNPDVLAKDYAGTDIKEVELTLDRDFVEVSGGAILRFARREWVLRVAHTVLGKNYSQLTSVSIGMLISFR